MQAIVGEHDERDTEAGEAHDDGDIRRDPRQVHRRQRGKNLAVALTLGGFMLLIYLVSIVRMSD